MAQHSITTHCPGTQHSPRRGDAPDPPAETWKRPGAPGPTIPPTTVLGLGLVALGLTTAATGAPTGPVLLAVLVVLVAVLAAAVSR